MSKTGVLRVTEVADPAPVWLVFFTACGPEVMLDAYGWEKPPTAPRGHERVFTFHDGPLLVAWSSVAEYPKEPGWYELAIGVWPEQQSKGYRAPVLAATADAVFADPSTDLITMLILDSCAGHAKVCLRQAEAGSPWVYAGRTWYPEPFRAFTLTRAAWASSPAATLDI